MTSTLSQIIVALLMLAVTVAVLSWFLRSEAAAAARRRFGMISRVGLDPAIAASMDPQTQAVMKEVRRRCEGCPREDACERWLTGEIDGDNAFCPNAPVFRELAEAG